MLLDLDNWAIVGKEIIFFVGSYPIFQFTFTKDSMVQLLRFRPIIIFTKND